MSKSIAARKYANQERRSPPIRRIFSLYQWYWYSGRLLQGIMEGSGKNEKMGAVKQTPCLQLPLAFV